MKLSTQVKSECGGLKIVAIEFVFIHSQEWSIFAVVWIQTTILFDAAAD